jgi:hypothetical protein
VPEPLKRIQIDQMLARTGIRVRQRNAIDAQALALLRLPDEQISAQAAQQNHQRVDDTGGGISPDGSRWITCRKNFFLPVRVLSRLFRKKFLKALRSAFRRDELRFAGDLRYLAAPPAFQSLCQKLAPREWVGRRRCSALSRIRSTD